jgi:hypothetical protein
VGYLSGLRTVSATAAVVAVLTGEPMHLGAALARRSAAKVERGKAAGNFDRKTAAFSIAFKGETSAYQDASAFVLPRTTLTIEAVGGPPGEYVFVAERGAFTARAARAWRWSAPGAPGLYTLEVHGPGDNDRITLHVFVRVPASRARNGVLNGYRIGRYPRKPLNGNPTYLPPSGFVEVTKKNEDTKLSPHFTLKQFLCKQDATKSFPKYVVLEERLPLKLEAILAQVNGLGVKVDTLHVMSGYRTPYYNRSIGDVPYSTHQWGGAADVYVDPGDEGQMEDLDGNHQVDVNDAKYLYDRIDEMLALKTFERFQGGMGFYPGTSAHPPFVHVDVRGTKARWKG